MLHTQCERLLLGTHMTSLTETNKTTICCWTFYIFRPDRKNEYCIRKKCIWLAPPTPNMWDRFLLLFLLLKKRDYICVQYRADGLQRSARSTRQYNTSPIVNCFCCTTTYHIDRLQNQYLPLSKAHTHTTNCVFKIYVFKGMAFDLYRDIYTSKLHGFNITYSSSSCNNNRHRAASVALSRKRNPFSAT